MKWFFIESLRVDLGNSIDQIHFYALLRPVKIPITHILKCLLAKIYKPLHIQTLHKCTHHTQ
jgi:hypothetical protein